MTARLEGLKTDSLVKGLVGKEAVGLISVQRMGDMACQVSWRAQDGNTGETIVLRRSEANLELVSGGRKWSFEGEGELFRLVPEAERIRLAYLFDHYVAVSSSAIDPLLHKISAVYEHMLPRQPMSFASQVSLTCLVMKDEVAAVQIAADRLAEAERKCEQPSPDGGGAFSPGPGIIKSGDPVGPRSTSPQPPQPPDLRNLPTTYTASVKLSSVTAGPQVGKFLDEVMSHLQALPGVEIEMTLEVQLRTPGGGDETTARIVLENSAALKVEKSGLY